MKIANIEVTLLGYCGSDLSVTNAARVSFHKESAWAVGYPSEDGSGKKLDPRDAKLIKYLATHKHHSPFNHSFLSFRVKAPIFVARQLQKHKFMPWNEVSRRYVDEEPEFYFPSYWRKKADNVKQGSSDEDATFAYQECLDTHYTPQNRAETVCERALRAYEDFLDAGICPEQARMVLPQNTMTEFVWSGTLGAFLDMLVLRLDPHTQKETQEVARLIATHVQQLFPVSYEAYLGNT